MGNIQERINVKKIHILGLDTPLIVAVARDAVTFSMQGAVVLIISNGYSIVSLSDAICSLARRVLNLYFSCMSNVDVGRGAILLT